MRVNVLGRENHPLAGYRWVLLPSFSPVQEGCAHELFEKCTPNHRANKQYNPTTHAQHTIMS